MFWIGFTTRKEHKYGVQQRRPNNDSTIQYKTERFRGAGATFYVLIFVFCVFCSI